METCHSNGDPQPGSRDLDAELHDSPGLESARHGDLVVMRGPRYLNRRAGREIGTLVHALMGNGDRRFLLDLETSDLVNHQGIAEILDLQKVVEDLGGALSFSGMSSTVEEIFHILGLNPGLPQDQKL